MQSGRYSSPRRAGGRRCQVSYTEFIYWLFTERYGLDGIAMAEQWLAERGLGVYARKGGAK